MGFAFLIGMEGYQGGGQMSQEEYNSMAPEQQAALLQYWQYYEQNPQAQAENYQAQQYQQQQVSIFTHCFTFFIDPILMNKGCAAIASAVHLLLIQKAVSVVFL